MRLVGPDGPLEVALPYDARLSADGTLEVAGETYWVETARDGQAVWVWWNGHAASFTLPEATGETSDKEARAPMTGRVVAVLVKPGDEVKRGDTLAILEAMKMEYRMEAEMDGAVEEIGADVGELVDLGQLLVRLK